MLCRLHGKKHSHPGNFSVRMNASIEEAIGLGAESGTGSLLDIVTVSEAPELCAVCLLSREELLEFFGSERPTIEQIEKSVSFWASFDRGKYQNDTDFLQSILNLRPDILARALSGIKK